MTQMTVADEIVRSMVTDIFILLAFAGIAGYAMDQKELLLFIIAGVGFVATILMTAPSRGGNEIVDALIGIASYGLLVTSIVLLGIAHF